MKILVTGAAGFIGYHVTNSLIESGNDVVGIDNLCDNKDLEIKKQRLSLLEIAPEKALSGEVVKIKNFTKDTITYQY